MGDAPSLDRTDQRPLPPHPSPGYQTRQTWPHELHAQRLPVKDGAEVGGDHGDLVEVSGSARARLWPLAWFGVRVPLPKQHSQPATPDPSSRRPLPAGLSPARTLRRSGGGPGESTSAAAHPAPPRGNYTLCTKSQSRTPNRTYTCCKYGASHLSPKSPQQTVSTALVLTVYATVRH